MVALVCLFADPTFTAVVHKAGDAIQVQAAGDGVVIAVTSRTGIGTATITLKDGRWPRDVTVRLNVKMLEGFTATTPAWRARGSEDASGNFPFDLPDEQGRFPENDSRPAGSLKVTVRKVAGGMEVMFPAHLFRTAATLELQWIDGYRR